MRVKPSNPDHAIGLIDPITKRSPFFDHDGKPLESADVPENTFWMRRLLAGEIARVDGSPVAGAPVAPLTTRG